MPIHCPCGGELVEVDMEAHAATLEYKPMVPDKKPG